MDWDSVRLFRNRVIGQLKYIRSLFLNLFQFVLHIYDQALSDRVIGLGPDGIDFPADFLADKSQFLPLPNFFLHGF